MNHASHSGHRAAHTGHHPRAATVPSLTAIAFRATLHCLSGCAVGEVWAW